MTTAAGGNGAVRELIDHLATIGSISTYANPDRPDEALRLRDAD